MSATKELEALVKLGEKMGHSGTDLAVFVQKERQRMKEESDKEKEFRLEQLKFEQVERENALREKELERQERAAVRAHEKEMRELHLAHVKDESPSVHKTKPPKLPPFDERKDNMDSYLNRFERYANNVKWQREEWACTLSALLTGKALEVYSRLDYQTANNYDELKKALLTRFRLNDEGFRSKFRNSKIGSDETCSQFINRLQNYLSRWVELSATLKTFDSLCDLFIREQFLESCSRPLAIFLKERRITSVAEMATLADQYVEAHRGLGSRDSKDSQPEIGLQKDPIPVMQQKASGGRRCFICDKPDHLHRSCPVRKQGKGQTQTDKVGALKVIESVSVGSESRLGQECQPTVVENNTECTEVDQSVAGSSDSLPVIGAAAMPDSAMLVVRGIACGKEVSVLRDTGSNTVVIRKSLLANVNLS